MDIRRLSVSEMRVNIRDVLSAVNLLHQRVVTAAYGRPMAVVANIEDWERLSGETLVDRAEEAGEAGEDPPEEA